MGGGRPEDFWDRRSRAYRDSTEGLPDPLVTFLESYCSPSLTLIDVGAGTGRHTVPLAGRLDWVTAVEPSQGMREQIPPLDNVTVIASRWEDAEVAPADLVICCHVLYAVAEPAPFIEKLEASARERIFICLREAPLRHPAERIWELLTGQARAPQPLFADLVALLRCIGVEPQVTWLTYPAEQRFRDLERALEDCRLRVGEAWQEKAGRAWLEANLERTADGWLVYRAGPLRAGVAHWRPRRQR